MNILKCLILIPVAGSLFSTVNKQQSLHLNAGSFISDTTPLIKDPRFAISNSLPAVIRPTGAFKTNATIIGGEPIANNTESKVNFLGVLFDENNCFSIATDEFKAPADGIYHFDLRVSWLAFSAPGPITLNIKSGRFGNIATSVQRSETTQVFDSNFGFMVKLALGETVSIYLIQASGAQQRYQQVQLSGFKAN